MLQQNAHLTYCTNIHPGETWEEVFESLKTYSLAVKKEVANNKPMGIGLRLSKVSAAVLVQKANLETFKNWLTKHQLYVFTINGFPYGDFHDTAIKDNVHQPDWSTQERVTYTLNLLYILTNLLPDGLEGGISTSPLSYKLWFDNDQDKIKTTLKACQAIIQIVFALIDIEKTTGKTLHLDIEPEPDGFLENTGEVLTFYKEYLFKHGVAVLQQNLKCDAEQAKQYILKHVQICYDVCHFALAYEKPQFVIDEFEKEGIQIGKIQISSALKCSKSDTVSIQQQKESLQQFNEPTYLHQSIVQLQNNKLLHFPDLKEGINAMEHPDFKEIRTHFHVPIFTEKFDFLDSTQNEIIEALTIWKEKPFTQHLEIETYTWGVLPKKLQTDITSSIIREFNWLLTQINP